MQTRSGNPIDPSNIHYPWKRLLARAGWPQSTRYHDLRGSAGSFLLAQGVPLPVVSRFFGHSNSSITLRHYIGVVDGMEGMAANGMGTRPRMALRRSVSLRNSHGGCG